MLSVEGTADPNLFVPSEQEARGVEGEEEEGSAMLISDGEEGEDEREGAARVGGRGEHYVLSRFAGPLSLMSLARLVL